MKKNENFMLKDVAGSTVLIPFGEMAFSFNGIITLNETAKFLWEKIDGEFDLESLTKLICDSYDDVTEDVARKSAEKFINSLKEAKAIE